MSANNKILVIFIAVVAFAIGAMMNSADVRDQDQIDSTALLQAKLIASEGEGIDSISNHLGALTLINFWASWCAPCRQEMPIFETFYRSHYKLGFNVVGVAIDSPEKTREMLDSMDISYPILYAEQTGMQLMDTAGNPDGFLPYSLLVDQHGNIIDQVLGQIHEQQLADWVSTHL